MKRYEYNDLQEYMEEDETGTYVKYTDHEAEVKKLKGINTGLIDTMKDLLSVVTNLKEQKKVLLSLIEKVEREQNG